MRSKNKEKTPQFRLLWATKKDPSLEDHTFEIQDWEFNKQRGKWFGFELNDFEKRELTRRQIYYQLNGGTLGAGVETPANDTIIVDLNFVYETNQFNELQAKAAIQKQIAFAEKVYGVIEIKFFKAWTAGKGNWKTLTIKEGRKPNYVNVMLTTRDDNKAVSATNVIPGKSASEDIIKDIFLIQSQFEGGGGLSDYSLSETSLAHELSHKFGLVGDPSDKVFGSDTFFGYNVRNWVSDAEINDAIKILNRGAVKKGFNWGNLGKSRSLPSGVLPANMKEFWASISTYDNLRIGARRLSKAN